MCQMLVTREYIHTKLLSRAWPGQGEAADTLAVVPTSHESQRLPHFKDQEVEARRGEECAQSHTSDIPHCKKKKKKAPWSQHPDSPSQEYFQASTSQRPSLGTHAVPTNTA